MNLYETAKNGFAIVGLLTVSGVIGLLLWHATVAIQRWRRRRQWSAEEKAKAKALTPPRTEDYPLGLESGWVERTTRPQELQ